MDGEGAVRISTSSARCPGSRRLGMPARHRGIKPRPPLVAIGLCQLPFEWDRSLALHREEEATEEEVGAHGQVAARSHREDD